uniref:(northern house mosquito) hypothetical protein n=1 Tax=Culex pipiens TaxID=7175 RepID=A0A8D8HZK1_CULPI
MLRSPAVAGFGDSGGKQQFGPAAEPAVRLVPGNHGRGNDQELHLREATHWAVCDRAAGRRREQLELVRGGGVLKRRVLAGSMRGAELERGHHPDDVRQDVLRVPHNARRELRQGAASVSVPRWRPAARHPRRDQRLHHLGAGAAQDGPPDAAGVDRGPKRARHYGPYLEMGER